MGTSTRTISVDVTVSGVPDHITDQKVIDKLAGQVRTGYLTWPEPRSFVESARVQVKAPAAAGTEHTAPAEA